MSWRSGLRFGNFVDVPRCKQPVPMPLLSRRSCSAIPRRNENGRYLVR